MVISGRGLLQLAIDDDGITFNNDSDGYRIDCVTPGLWVDPSYPKQAKESSLA